MTALRNTPVKRKTKTGGPLRRMWERVEVKSCADGSMKIEPVWKGVREYTEADGGGPGLLSRLSAAKWCEFVINQHLEGKS